jgi:hypothetical protein
MGKNIILTEQQLGDLFNKILKSIFGGDDDDVSSSDDSETPKDSEVISNITDKNIYEKILQGLGAPTTNENLKFLYAWRQSEGKAGKYNPFNTTQGMPGATKFNSVGVKNYMSAEDGINATLKTLKNGRYNCIVNGLKGNIGAKKISTDCISDLKTWGTGDLIAKVITGYEKGSTPKLSSLTA